MGCGKEYFEKGALKVHMNSHVEGKPFKCSYPFCVKTFKTIVHMKDHLTSHLQK
jgi:hypothetical protein